MVAHLKARRQYLVETIIDVDYPEEQELLTNTPT